VLPEPAQGKGVCCVQLVSWLVTRVTSVVSGIVQILHATLLNFSVKAITHFQSSEKRLLHPAEDQAAW
jgi:hypothetical protein